MSQIILPHGVRVARQREALERLSQMRPACPAAQMGAYADSGKTYLNCRVERRHFPVDEAPVAVMGWCCDNYQDCPVWQADKTNDPALARTRARQDEDRAGVAESGLRVPDEAREAEDEIQHIIREEREEARMRKLNEEE